VEDYDDDAEEDSDNKYGVWGLIGEGDALRLKGHGFEFHSSRHVGTLGKPSTRSYLLHVNSGTVSIAVVRSASKRLVL